MSDDKEAPKAGDEILFGEGKPYEKTVLLIDGRKITFASDTHIHSAIVIKENSHTCLVRKIVTITGGKEITSKRTIKVKKSRIKEWWTGGEVAKKGGGSMYLEPGWYDEIIKENKMIETKGDEDD